MPSGDVVTFVSFVFPAYFPLATSIIISVILSGATGVPLLEDKKDEPVR